MLGIMIFILVGTGVSYQFALSAEVNVSSSLVSIAVFCLTISPFGWLTYMSSANCLFDKARASPMLQFTKVKEMNSRHAWGLRTPASKTRN